WPPRAARQLDIAAGLRYGCRRPCASSPPPTKEPPVRVDSFADPPALLRGLTALFHKGLSARGLLFLALDSRGAIHMAIPDQAGQSTIEQSVLRVGEKLTLRWPGEPRVYHFDSVHVLREDFYVFNGDRRLAHPGDAVEVGLVVANFLRWCQCKNVFFGCTP